MAKIYDKISKLVTETGIVDVSPNLYRYTEKGKDLVYQGKLIFSFWQDSGVYQKAHMDKDLCKVMCYSVMTHTFDLTFGKGGLQDGKGSVHGDVVRARTFTITHPQPDFYVLRLQEGPGMVDDQTGTIAHQGEAEHDITLSIPLLAMLTLAHEVYDYIRDAEMQAMMQNRSLHTKSSTLFKEEDETSAYVPPAVGGNWQIPFGRLKGRYIRDLTNEQLTFILQQKAADTVMKDMQHHTQIEWNKRKG